MRKVAINRCFGGFGLSDEAFEKLLARKNVAFDKVESDSALLGTHYYQAGHSGDDEYYISSYEYIEDRSDSDLIAVIEEMGDAANGWASEIAIVEIPDDVEWHIDEYDGREHVAENHRTWY
jgi:hypothetical protein